MLYHLLPRQDAAIGNIMGSNSANVFLGLGIPWVIASLYYQVGLVIRHSLAGRCSRVELCMYIRVSVDHFGESLCHDACRNSHTMLLCDS